MAGENDQLSFKISKALKAELKKLADADRRALSPYVILALEKHVAEEKARAKRK
jgi:predicted transcriptional regulator